MLTRRGKQTSTARNVLWLYGATGVLLVGALLATAFFVIQRLAPPQALGSQVAGTPLPSGNPATVSTSTLSASERPITWTVRMAPHPVIGQPEGVVDDPRVYQMVQDDYLAGGKWFLTQAVTLTQLGKDAIPQLETYFTDSRLYEMLGLLDYFRRHGRAYTTTLIARQIEVRNFSEDGQQVYLGDSCAGGKATWYALDGSGVVLEEDLPPRIVIITMRYDPTLRRWREAASRVPTIPASVTPGPAFVTPGRGQ